MNQDPNIDPTAWAPDDDTLRSYRPLGWLLVGLAVLAGAGLLAWWLL